MTWVQVEKGRTCTRIGFVTLLCFMFPFFILSFLFATAVVAATASIGTTNGRDVTAAATTFIDSGGRGGGSINGRTTASSSICNGMILCSGGSVCGRVLMISGRRWRWPLLTGRGRLCCRRRRWRVLIRIDRRKRGSVLELSKKI